MNRTARPESTLTRRSIVKGSLVGFTGLTLGFPGLIHGSTTRSGSSGEEGHIGHALGLWLNIAENDRITIIVVKNEMGQGISTALPMIIAEELDADWETIEVALRPELDERFLPGWHATYSSQSIVANWEIMRKAGAAAREMLLQAAAQRWGVDPASLSTHGGTVSHPRYGDLTYGQLAAAASAMELPESPELKDPADFRLIGQPLPRVDARDHVDGTRTYGIDVVVDGMLYAAVKQSPVFGGEVANFDSLDAEAAGVEAIVLIPNGVAAVAKSWWEAQRALDSLDVEFSAPDGMRELSSDSMQAALAAAAERPEKTDRVTGDANAAMDRAHTVVDATYEVPLLAHATMEPMCCAAHVTADRCEVWAPTQYAEGIRWEARRITGLRPGAIKIHTISMGGGFGRKAETDFVAQAITISKACGTPVKLIWSREEDVQHDRYRPPMCTIVKAGLDTSGRILSWISQCAQTPTWDDDGTWNLWGLNRLPYEIADFRVDYVSLKFGVPVGWLRGVGYSKHTFTVESFIDELALAASIDPIEFRLRHLQQDARAVRVLETVAQMASWGRPSVAGAAHGVAFLQHWGSYVAQIAKVSLDPDNRIRVHRVYTAVDVGTVINPDILKAQVEGSTVFGISTGVYGEITLDEGRVQQSNFHDYPLLNLADAPQVETSIIESQESPGGIGEYAVATAVPAVTNAIRTLTGDRIRSLPVTRHGYS